MGGRPFWYYPGMSSTNRGGKQVPDGNYATPMWAIRVVLPLLPRATRVLDPAAGRGNILRAVSEYYGSRDEPYVLAGIELDPKRAQAAALIDRVSTVLLANSLLLDVTWDLCDGAPDLIITNPPFVLAEAMLRKALKSVAPGGTVCFLLPLPFISGGCRKAFWEKAATAFNPVMPDVHVLTKRPSFRKIRNSSNDSVEYAWFIFSPTSTGRWFRLEPDEPKVAREKRLDTYLETKPTIMDL